MVGTRIFIVFIVSVLFSSASAQNKGFGLGVILGEPSGISGKLWNGKNTAIDGAIAWSLGQKDAFHLHGDHLFHDFGLLPVEKGLLALFYGIGGRLRFEEDHDTRIALRIPVGLSYLFAGAPLDLFLELVPILELIPGTEFDMDAGIGIRYYFGKSANTKP